MSFTFKLPDKTDKHKELDADKYIAVDRETYFSNYQDQEVGQFLEFIDIYAKLNKFEISNEMKTLFVRYLKDQQTPYNFEKIISECNQKFLNKEEVLMA